MWEVLVGLDNRSVVVPAMYSYRYVKSLITKVLKLRQ